jgi:hypothetical protein
MVVSVKEKTQEVVVVRQEMGRWGEEDMSGRSGEDARGRQKKGEVEEVEEHMRQMVGRRRRRKDQRKRRGQVY